MNHQNLSGVRAETPTASYLSQRCHSRSSGLFGRYYCSRHCWPWIPQTVGHHRLPLVILGFGGRPFVHNVNMSLFFVLLVSLNQRKTCYRSLWDLGPINSSKVSVIGINRFWKNKTKQNKAKKLTIAICN